MRWRAATPAFPRRLIEALLALLRHEVYPLDSRARVGGRLGRPRAAGALERRAARHRPGARRRQDSRRPRRVWRAPVSSPRSFVRKEGLALINGTQVSTALALAGLFGAEDVLAAGIVAGAMSVDALKGSDAPFDDRIHQARGQPGADRRGARISAPDRRQRDSRLASRLLARAGPLLVPLPAAGHGRLSRSHPPMRRDASRRSQCGHR